MVARLRPAHGSEQHDHIVHRAGHDAAHQNPQGAGHVPELGRQHRSQQGPARRDGRKVVAEKHKLVGFDVVVSVRVFHGGRLVRLSLSSRTLIGEKKTVESVTDSKYLPESDKHNG